VQATRSTDGEHWKNLGSVTVPFASSSFYVGLPVTSHNAAAMAIAVFDDVTITTF
jgi:hypothetical protein